ncbi:hypothetical protein AKJ09_06577 [Labilithrix luteola]|uniref:Uncharacterized protein n=1 Tax=Labilithrix luteola TaxID=1391654 RepID=A0A0K1Q2B8_9BACT|nr:hypothetical protein [Labilithrix luteola]AKU99913.1 hypothetical protein AKJ09_06577 [Labilithrix luteola]
MNATKTSEQIESIKEALANSREQRANLERLAESLEGVEFQIPDEQLDAYDVLLREEFDVEEPQRIEVPLFAIPA